MEAEKALIPRGNIEGSDDSKVPCDAAGYYLLG